jgi:hypothetical protein
MFHVGFTSTTTTATTTAKVVTVCRWVLFCRLLKTVVEGDVYPGVDHQPEEDQDQREGETA